MTAIASWIPANIYYALLPVRFGLKSVATLRALMNLMYPLLHVVTALLLLLIPVLVRQRQTSGLTKMKRTVMQLTALFVPVGIAYLLILALFSYAILHLLYAGRYSDVSTWVIITIGALPITGGVAGLLAAGLRALERPQLIFWSYIASAVVALVVGVPLTLHYGVSGTALALLLNDLPAIGALGICLARYKQDSEPRAYGSVNLSGT
jgi:O-antigen/teichoic acid export membrane protein